MIWIFRKFHYSFIIVVSLILCIGFLLRNKIVEQFTRGRWIGDTYIEGTDSRYDGTTRGNEYTQTTSGGKVPSQLEYMKKKYGDVSGIDFGDDTVFLDKYKREIGLQGLDYRNDPSKKNQHPKQYDDWYWFTTPRPSDDQLDLAASSNFFKTDPAYSTSTTYSKRDSSKDSKRDSSMDSHDHSKKDSTDYLSSTLSNIQSLGDIYSIQTKKGPQVQSPITTTLPPAGLSDSVREKIHRDTVKTVRNELKSIFKDNEYQYRLE
jgi:hypothetical protein